MVNIMDPSKKNDQDIHITVLSDGHEYQIKTYPNAYRNLMDMLFDQLDLEGFGECKGMGKCGTCRIQILSGDIPHNGLRPNEEATLRKQDTYGPGIRLSCSISIDKNIDHLNIRIPEQE